MGLICPDARVPPLSVFSLHLFKFFALVLHHVPSGWLLAFLWAQLNNASSLASSNNDFLLELLPARTPAVSFVIQTNHRLRKPPPPPVSSPESLWPLSPCADYSRYLIKHLDPPRWPQRATVPPLTHFPPYCVKLWKGVKQNKEGPLKDVATGT